MTVYRQERICEKCQNPFVAKNYYRNLCVDCRERKSSVNVAEVRVCIACNEEYKPTSSRQRVCFTCTPDKGWQARYRRYGITKPQFDIILQKLGNKCPLCFQVFVTESDAMIDHDHKTGKFRGLLCSNCNMVLHRFEDEDYVVRVAKYLNGGEFTCGEEEVEAVQVSI